MTTIDDIKTLGTILFIGAHPDDETFVAGGLLYTAAKNGQKVICVTATRGEQGVQDESHWPRAELGDIRERELEAALQELGVNEHHILGYPDGQCQTIAGQEAVSKLRQIIDRHQPNTIITFGPDGMTGHQDHQAVSAWAAAVNSPATVYHAVQTVELQSAWQLIDNKLNYFYNVDKPIRKEASECALYFVLPEDALAAKYAALNKMPSQYEKLFQGFDEASIKKVFSIEAFVKA